MSTNRSGPAAAPAPPALRAARDLEAALPGLAHDLRAATTAVTSFGQLLEQRYGGAIDPTGRSFLDAIQANAEVLAHLTEALACLAGGPGDTPAPLSEVTRNATERWQKFLSRVQISLKVPGEIPDSLVERRSFGVLLGQVLLMAGRSPGRHERTQVEISAHAGAEGVVVSLRFESECPADAAATLNEEMEEAMSDSGFSGVLLRSVLERLGATLSVDREPALRVGIHLPGRARS